MRIRLMPVLFVVLLAGCRSAAPPEKTDGSGGFPSALAEPATSLPASATATVSTPTGRATPTSPSNSEETPGASAPPSFSVRGRFADASGDAGSKAPAYADLASVTIESDGTNARVTVVMRGAVPSQMAADEQMAVGVDIYRSANDAEGAYQLYASGNDEGWVAFLDTPGGFVRYPGTFQIGGTRLVFTVPWSSLGGLRRAYASSFADWDRKGLVLHDVGQDRAPDRGTFSYT